MENNQQQILSEIKSLMASVRSQLEELDTKIAQWQQMVEPEEVIDVTSVIGEVEFFDRVYEFGYEPDANESPLEQESEQLYEPVDEVVEELVEEPVEEQVIEDTVFEQTVFDEKPLPEPAPVVLNEVHASAEKTAVIDAMTQKHRWRTAMPGAPVKDIRGAIALMDRVLFINTLFGTDPMAFQDALTQINQMSTLDQAVEYLSATHPEWDFDSDVVYSFMMAVRRKVNA